MTTSIPATLLAELGPLPIQGRAWSKAIAWLACLVVIGIGVRLVLTASGPHGQGVSPMIIAAIVMAYVGIIVMAWYMYHGQTRITEEGISQSWLFKRHIAWQDIRHAKFVPMLFSKRLICFPVRGRPVTFQGSDQDVQVAFARIALAYRHKA